MVRKFVFYIILIVALISTSCKTGELTTKDSAAEKDYNFKFNSLFLEANKHKQLGEYELSLEYYTHALKLCPDNATVMYEISGIVAILGDLPSAIKYAKSAVELESENLYFNVMLADLYQANGMVKEAAETYTSIIKIESSKLELYFEQSTLYVAVGEYSKAIKTLNKAEKQFGVIEVLSLEKERIFRSTEQPDKAIKELQGLVDEYPYRSRYSAMLAESYLEKEDINSAGQVYEKMLKHEINDGYVHISIADYYRIIENYDKTFEHLELAFSSFDVEIDVKIQLLASMLTVVGNDTYLNAKVYRLLDILLDLYPTEPKVLTMYSDFLVKDGKWKEAQEALDKVLVLEKSKYLIWEQALYIDGQLEDFEHMLATSNQAKELFPFQPMIYLFNSVSALQLKEYETVIESVKKGISLSGGNKKLEIELLSYQGEAFHKLDMHHESDSVFDKLLELDPDNSFIINNYTYYLALRKDKTSKAVEMGQKLILFDPNNYNYLDTYAWALFANGDYSKSKEIIEKAIEKGGKDNPTICEHYGDILHENGEVDKAVQQWERAISFGADSDELKAKIANKALTE